MSSTFDQFVESYEEACQQGLSFTGETRDYFARARVNLCSDVIRRRSIDVRSILDFGCGLGHTTPLFCNELPSCEVVGLDNSAPTIEQASRINGKQRVRFTTELEPSEHGTFDIAYCNGVFHHIPPAARVEQAQLVFDALRKGGVFAFWENNPWNIGTRYVMSKIPFDRDAITLSFLESQRLLTSVGFQVIQTTFHFFFPSFLRRLRPLEPALRGLPLGGQYCVLACKPTGDQ